MDKHGTLRSVEVDLSKEGGLIIPMNGEQKQCVLIYRDHLLAPSETFIRSQAEGMDTYHSAYIGSRAVRGLELDKGRTYLVNQGTGGGRLAEIVFKKTGLSFGLIRKLAKLKPRLIHAHFGPDGVLALPIARRLGLPLVISFHGYDVTTKESYARKSYFTHRNYLKKRHKLQRKGDLFIAVSQFIKNRLLQQGFPEEKVILHYIGVDTDEFRSDPALPRENIVLFVGRLTEVKGCEYLIRAMEVVQQSNPDAELVVIGDGPLRPSLENLAACKLRKYRFMGVQPTDEVKRWMNRARVFSVPSIAAKSGAEEAFGIVFIEASSMGLPVASFATGGIPESVADGVSGLLSKPRDWQGLAHNIERLLQDDQLWKQLSTAGRSRVEQEFNLKTQTRKLEGLYNSLLYGQSSAARSADKPMRAIKGMYNA